MRNDRDVQRPGRGVRGRPAGTGGDRNRAGSPTGDEWPAEGSARVARVYDATGCHSGELQGTATAVVEVVRDNRISGHSASNDHFRDAARGKRQKFVRAGSIPGDGGIVFGRSCGGELVASAVKCGDGDGLCVSKVSGKGGNRNRKRNRDWTGWLPLWRWRRNEPGSRGR